ncbi:MAG: hypothetical protein H6R10_730 [Rhodocyclaceae bacterium]|nr:hypothetical protein [Rhodocyclaceae bacterium]
MPPITLDAIKAEHSRIGEMIAAFEAQASKPEAIHFPEALIEINPGEHYAGLIVGKDGEPSYHLILLPGQADDITWDKAKDWAKEAGGELPTRREQALLYANLKEQFEERWYWSGEINASAAEYAWSQTFYDGYQSYGHRSSKLRARAVRRLEIQ